MNLVGSTKNTKIFITNVKKISYMNSKYFNKFKTFRKKIKMKRKLNIKIANISYQNYECLLNLDICLSVIVLHHYTSLFI